MSPVTASRAMTIGYACAFQCSRVLPRDSALVLAAGSAVVPSTTAALTVRTAAASGDEASRTRTRANDRSSFALQGTTIAN